MSELDIGTATDALRAVLEALDVPHAATVGDDETRAKILLERVGHAVVMLNSILHDEHPAPDAAWSVGYLRDRLAEHPATMTHADLPLEERERMGITPGLVRVSVGVEHYEDIIADLRQALDAVGSDAEASARRPRRGALKGAPAGVLQDGSV